MTVKPIPDGYHTVTPWIISRDTAGLIDYPEEAFDAEEIARVVGDDVRIEHAEVRIGDSIVMPFDAPPVWPPTPAFLRLYVEDADAAHRRRRGRRYVRGRGDAPLLRRPGRTGT